MLFEINQKYHSHCALRINSNGYTYDQLDTASRLIAAELAGDVVGILAGRSFEAYACILASIRSGRTYIPFNTELPVAKLGQQLALAAPDVLLVDASTITLTEQLLASYKHPVTVVCATSFEGASEAGRRYVLLKEAPPLPADRVDRETDADLYQMFTSGSTGAPKRVRVSRRSVAAYLASIRDEFDFHQHDRFSQFFRLSFDLSVHDILVAWSTGATLVVPTQNQLLDPIGFANEHDVSVWFSVPSLVRLAMITRKLKPGSLPNVRHALFCGEALSWEVADAFAAAAPNARLTNLYGPTETTIAITRHHLLSGAKNEFSERSTSVPIGKPFSGQEVVVMGSDLNPVREGAVGELFLGGSQLAPGYCDNSDEDAARFLLKEIDGFKATRWYRTGDLVRCESGQLVFVGREDTQIKYRGHRIELAEIEAAIADVSGSPLAVVMLDRGAVDHSIDKLVAFVAPPHEPVPMVQEELRNILPRYMLPSSIITIPHDINVWNANGKVDRKKMHTWYKSTEGAATDDR